MNITPTHTTFEQAKLLKEKGFDVRIKTYYRITGSGVFESNGPANYNDDSTQETAGGMTYVSVPEQWMVIEWLRVKHGIWVYVSEDEGIYKVSDESWGWTINKTQNYGNGFKTPQEAYSAAFDHALKELL